MGDHRDAWDGMTLLVFDTKPITPMLIEQSIASAAPWLETKIESFEVYEDALAHCRDRRDVGLIIIGDRTQPHTSEEIFRNLAAPYESAMGWSAAGVLYGADNFSLEGFRAMSADHRFIEYTNIQSLTEISQIQSNIDRIWQLFVHRTENSLFPDSMQRILFALSDKVGFSYAAQSFVQRSTTLLASDLNLSWYDNIGLRWAHVFYSLKDQHPEVLASNRRLSQLVANITDHFSSFDLKSGKSLELIASSKSIPLASRLGLVVQILNNARSSEDLVSVLDQSKLLSKPGAPALIRILARHAESILLFDNQADSDRFEINIGNAV